eukprot:TRINITY_DN570_c0_g1_i6.p1 TRINITY_DN570_c0_g1~~TRINITY_DN570_c0_g1_i6.p1  ORF type:complete len:291 (-),score=33.65 TRINITY_DN570_c0_g1_i6:57-929(-)
MDARTRALSSATHSSAEITACRDIKPENLLLDQYRQRLLITDFGYAKMLGTDSAQLMETPCGTYKFMAPEILQIVQRQRVQAYHGGAVDVWASGVVVFVMCAASFPWTLASSTLALDQPPSEEFARHERGEWAIPEEFSAHLADFLQRCCVIDPDHRASAQDLVEHPWLQPQLPEQEDPCYRSSSELTDVRPEFLSYETAPETRHNGCGQRAVLLVCGWDKVQTVLADKFRVQARSEELLVSAEDMGTVVSLVVEVLEGTSYVVFTREKGACSLEYHLLVNSIQHSLSNE